MKAGALKDTVHELDEFLLRKIGYARSLSGLTGKRLGAD